MDPISQEFCDMMAEMTPELRAVTLGIMQATWQRDGRGAAMRAALAALSELSTRELRGMIAQLEEQGASA